MKRITAVLLSLIMIVAMLASCSANSSSNDDGEDKKEKNRITEKDKTDEKKEEPEEKVENEVEEPEEETPLFKTILDRTMDETVYIDNYGMDATVYFDIAMLSGFLEVTMDITSERDGDFAYNSTVAVIDSLGVGSVSETYTDYDERTEYTCTDGYWTEETVSGEAGSLAFEIPLLVSCMEEGNVDDVVYGDKDCYEITGEVEIDFLELMKTEEMGGVAESLEEYGIGEDAYEKVFSDKVPFKVELGIDKTTYLPVYFEVDLTNMFDSYIGAATEYVSEVTEEDDVDSSVKDCRISAEYRDYGNVSIEIPYNEIYSSYYEY